MCDMTLSPFSFPVSSLPPPSSPLPSSPSSSPSLASIPDLTQQMIGYRLKTKQTPGDGVTVRQVMVAESLDIARETYFAIVMDRGFQGPVLVGSPEGGVDIEEVSEKSPEKIFKVAEISVEMFTLLLPWQCHFLMYQNGCYCHGFCDGRISPAHDVIFGVAADPN